VECLSELASMRFCKISTKIKIEVKFQASIKEGTFFLAGEGWEILVFFSQKSVGPPLRFNKKYF